MLKQIKKIDGSKVMSKSQQQSVKGGLTLYVDQCSPAANGLPCMVDGHDGRCSGFVCSPNCVH